LVQWVCYFLEGIEETAAIGVSTLSAVLELKKRLEQQIEDEFGRRSPVGKKLLNGLFLEPTITVEKAAQITGLSFKAANDLVVLFQEKGILKEQTGQARNRIFVFQDYLKAFDH